MKKGIIIIISFVLIVIIGALILYNNIFPLAKPIELPKVNEVYTVEIKKENITAKYTDDKEILEILNCFFSAKPTRVMTAHDTPTINEYYTVNFYSKEDRLYTSFIYNKNSKWYIEQPYYGVYEIKEELFDFYFEPKIINPDKNDKIDYNQSTKDALGKLANQEFSIQGNNLSNGDDEKIVEFGKAFVNLFNGAVAEQEKVSFEKYISNKNLRKFTEKMLELTQKQDLQGGNAINYGLNNEFKQANLQHIEDNLCYLELTFEFEGSGMTCKMLITSEDKTLKLVDLYFGNKDGVDTFATGHHAVRKVKDPNLWENEEWVKDVFDKLKEFEKSIGE